MLKFRERTNSWPGFVDLFSNLVIILIFLLIVFVFLWTTTTVFNNKASIKRVAELSRANADQAQTISSMSADSEEAKRLLVLARAELESMGAAKSALESQVAALTDQQRVLIEQTDSLLAANTADFEKQLREKDADLDQLTATFKQQLDELNANRDQMQAMVQNLTDQLNAAQTAAQDKAALTEEQAAHQADLAAQIARLNAALADSEQKIQDQKVQYMEMSNRLNKALADKIAQMNEYQSAFYRAVKTALANVPGIEIDGDRFIIASDILFASGAYSLSADGKNQMRLIARVIKDLENQIPTDVKWIIRVDGHTDKRPVIPGTPGFSNNMQLSLLRATAVKNELIANGVSPRRLIPSGFGDLYPLELGTSPAEMQKNRRIELRLTNP
ncbi:MAG: OmpA family protein [Proteobacteria bacterium]|nr:OmpA family protein [Pseudomonadota bacterium]